MIQLYFVVGWNAPDFNTLKKFTVAHGLTKKGDILEWHWADKITNTIQFGIYYRALSKDNISGEYFHGGLPIEFIEMITGQQKTK